jgi:hypothetical protein
MKINVPIIEPLLPSLFSFKKIYFLIWWQILPSSTNLVYIAEDKFICKQRLASFLPVSRCYLKLCPSEKIFSYENKYSLFYNKIKQEWIEWVTRIRLFTVIAYIYIYSQLQVYVSRHMILVNFMFTPDEFRYKNNQ